MSSDAIERRQRKRPKQSEMRQCDFCMLRSAKAAGGDWTGARHALKSQGKKIVHAKAKEEARDILKEARETANRTSAEELRALNKLDSLGERNRRVRQRTGPALKMPRVQFAEKLVKTGQPESLSTLRSAQRRRQGTGR